MTQYERNRVLVDQCTECKGIFLDRGEFENLVEAEKAYYGSSVGAAASPPDDRMSEHPPARSYDEPRYSGRTARRSARACSRNYSISERGAR